MQSDAIAAVNTESDDVADISADRSDAYNTALIEEQQQINAKRVSDAEADVAKVDGLAKAVEGLSSAQNSYTSAVEAQEETAADAEGAVVKFKTLQSASASAYTAPAANAEAATGVVTIDSVDAIDLVDGELVLTSAFKEEDGADALLAAVKADLSAIRSVATAEGNLNTAVGAVLDLENEGWNEVAVDATGTVSFVDSADPDVSVMPTALYTDESGTVYAADLAKGSNASGLDDGDLLYVVNDLEATAKTGADATATFNSGATNTVTIAGNAADFTAVSATNTVTVEESGLFIGDYVDTTAKDDGYLTTGATPSFEADAPLAQELNAAQNEQEAFDKAVNEYLDAKATADELEGYNDDIDTCSGEKLLERFFG